VHKVYFWRIFAALAIVAAGCGGDRCASAPASTDSYETQLSRARYLQLIRIKRTQAADFRYASACQISLSKFTPSDPVDPRVVSMVNGENLQFVWYANGGRPSQYIALVQSSLGQALVRVGIQHSATGSTCNVFEGIDLPDVLELDKPPTLFETTLPDFAS
jgi:hypothetical protein